MTDNDRIVVTLVLGVLFGGVIGILIFQGLGKTEQASYLATAAVLFIWFVAVLTTIILGKMK